MSTIKTFAMQNGRSASRTKQSDNTDPHAILINKGQVNTTDYTHPYVTHNG